MLQQRKPSGIGWDQADSGSTASANKMARKERMVRRVGNPRVKFLFDIYHEFP